MTLFQTLTAKIWTLSCFSGIFILLPNNHWAGAGGLYGLKCSVGVGVQKWPLGGYDGHCDWPRTPMQQVRFREKVLYKVAAII